MRPEESFRSDHLNGFLQDDEGELCLSTELRDRLSKEISTQLKFEFEREKEELYEHLKESFRNAQKQQAAQFRCEAAEKKTEHASALAEESRLRRALEGTCAEQISSMKALHEGDKAHWETMLARRNRDSKLFTFTVQGCEGPGLSGCVPRQIFDAEPDSALAHIYNGEWEYTTDDRGRAVVNSDPAHWPIIIRWLSFGTVPDDPTPQLISDCKYWQLNRLLTAINAARNGKTSQGGCRFQAHRVALDGHYGFRAEACIPDFPQQLVQAANKRTWVTLPFKATGRDWVFKVNMRGAMDLQLAAGSALTIHQMRIDWGSSNKTLSCSADGSRLQMVTSQPARWWTLAS